MIPLQIRITDNETSLTAADVPYGVAMISELDFAFIVDVDGEMTVMSPYEFACHSAACRPPGSGGTGGSINATGGAHPTSDTDLDLLFPGRQGGSGSHKEVYDDGTFSVEGLNEDGSFKTFKDKTEAKLKGMWDDIGPSEEDFIANFAVAGKLAMGIDPLTGKINEKQAAQGLKDSKWYHDAHNDVADVSKNTGIPEDACTAAVTTLSAGRLWSGPKNGNIETLRFLADIVKNPIDIEISQQHLDMMAWREGKSQKGVGRVGLTGHGLKVGTANSKDLDAGTLVELMYAVNTLRGHPTLKDWMTKTMKDGKPGGKSSKEQMATPGQFPIFTSKGTQQVKQAVSILRGEVTPRQAISGPKYSSFYSNIRNPDKDYSSTNDTWHYRIMAGNLQIKTTKGGVEHSKTIKDHSMKDHSPDGVIQTTQGIFQRAGSSKAEGLADGDGMFRDTTRLTRRALDRLKAEHPKQFGRMKIHEFQALIWVHYGGGQKSDKERTDRWFGALDTMRKLGL